MTETVIVTLKGLTAQCDNQNISFYGCKYLNLCTILINITKKLISNIKYSCYF